MQVVEILDKEKMTKKNPFDGKLFQGGLDSHGPHPKCKKCLTRKEGKCRDVQYAAMGVADFYCADYKSFYGPCLPQRKRHYFGRNTGWAGGMGQPWIHYCIWCGKYNPKWEPKFWEENE